MRRIKRSAARALVDGDAAAAQSLKALPAPAADHCLRTSISDQPRQRANFEPVRRRIGITSIVELYPCTHESGSAETGDR